VIVQEHRIGYRVTTDSEQTRTEWVEVVDFADVV
jgi:hypothetical protein